jgi:dTDP-4-dehydrorhamnose 3,5-epimerase
MTLLDEPLTGALLLQSSRFADERGIFVKTYHQGIFQQLGIHFTPKEEYISVSHKGVLRGMHFQMPPKDHAKLVFCMKGNALDVLLDLRKNEPTFGKVYSTLLSEKNRHLLYIPSGIAHGFVSLKEDTTMIYKTSTVHSPEHDRGIRWDSFGFDWEIESPIISMRDSAHPAFAEFNSPF